MIGYVTLGTKDIAKATAFYDELLTRLGATKAYSSEKFVAWRTGEGQPMLSVVIPFNGEPATAGNGTMIGLSAPDTETVDKLHALALALGGTNEGDAGLRSSGFYSGYFRDLDGNKLNFFCAGQPE
jgi:predicted lactoylglutathione lyase